jgi:hypothetical protein
MEPLTFAEKTGAIVGLLFGALVIFVSLDLLSGGLFSRTRRAAPAAEPDGGCDGCGD